MVIQPEPRTTTSSTSVLPLSPSGTSVAPPAVSSPTSRSQSPHFPTPSSTFVPPPSENEEFERIMKLKVESSTVAAKSPTKESSSGSSHDRRPSAERDHQPTGALAQSPNISHATHPPESTSDGLLSASPRVVVDGEDGPAVVDGSREGELASDDDDQELTPRIPQLDDSIDLRRVSTASSLSQPHPLDMQPIPHSSGSPSSHPQSLPPTHSPDHGDPNHRNPTDGPAPPNLSLAVSQPDSMSVPKSSSSSSAASLASGTSSSRSRRRRRRVSPVPPQPAPPPGPPLSIRDFAFQSSDERHIGQGPLRAEIFLARAAAAAEASSDSSNNGWGSSGGGFGVGGRRFGFGGGEDDEEDDDDGYEDEDSDEERDDGYEEPMSAASSTGSFPPPEPAGGRYQVDPEPGVYRALYAFQSEAPAELSLSEGDLVRVHASGGVGWVVATLLVPNDDDQLVETGQQGLVPLGYLTSAPQ